LESLPEWGAIVAHLQQLIVDYTEALVQGNEAERGQMDRLRGRIEMSWMLLELPKKLFLS
jgi:hypothetical protein